MAAVFDAGFHERDNFLLEQVERIWRRFFRKRGKKFLSLLGRVVSINVSFDIASLVIEIENRLNCTFLENYVRILPLLSHR